MSGIIDLFIPKEKKFFSYLTRQVSILVECSSRLAALSKPKNTTLVYFKTTFKHAQKQSDVTTEISKEIIIALHETFITPIDREEIQSLSLNLSRSLDILEKIAASVLYLRVKKLDASFLKQLLLLEEAAQELKAIFDQPLVKKHNLKHIERIKEIEEEADEVFGKATGHLYNNGHNAIEILKQKELYDFAEEAIDAVRSTADLLDIILINND